MNLGWTEIVLIGGIALLLFGPSKLPGLGRSLGESIRGFKKAINEDPADEREAQPAQQVTQKSERPISENVEVKHDETVKKNS